MISLLTSSLCNSCKFCKQEREQWKIAMNAKICQTCKELQMIILQLHANLGISVHPAVTCWTHLHVSTLSKRSYLKV